MECDCGARSTFEEVIVQTCTTEGSVGDVVKRSPVQESEPGQVRAKERLSMVTPRASAEMLIDALTVSVGFFAVADVRPTRERQGRCRQREASD